MNGKILQGMDEITTYAGRDKRTIYAWIREEGFPAIKVNGRWESNTELIDKWRVRRIERVMSSDY